MMQQLHCMPVDALSQARMCNNHFAGYAAGLENTYNVCRQRCGTACDVLVQEDNDDVAEPRGPGEPSTSGRANGAAPTSGALYSMCLQIDVGSLALQ